MAPEAGSERLRRVINKGLSEADILRGAEALAVSGAERLKLYFMIGLPTEEAEDVDEIIALARRVKHRLQKRVAPSGKMPRLALSVASFVPKPHTPFQWAPQEEVAVLKERLKPLERRLRREGVEVSADVPKYAYVQAVLARGDRRVAQFLTAYQQAASGPPRSARSTSTPTSMPAGPANRMSCCPGTSSTTG